MPNSLDNQTTELSREVGEILSRFSTEVLKHSTGDLLKVLQREDLSMPRMATLMFIARKGSGSVSHICEHLNLALGTTSHLVEQLVSAGLVERQENPDDRRHKVVSLTERGRVLVSEIGQARISDLARRMEHLPPELLRNMIDVMSEVLMLLREQDTTSR
jgi:DNA-binding MarR family transcriptional regulator